jgi:hypothetical protein
METVSWPSLRVDLVPAAGYYSPRNTPALHLGFLAPIPPNCGRVLTGLAAPEYSLRDARNGCGVEPTSRPQIASGSVPKTARMNRARYSFRYSGL